MLSTCSRRSYTREFRHDTQAVRGRPTKLEVILRKMRWVVESCRAATENHVQNGHSPIGIWNINTPSLPVLPQHRLVGQRHAEGLFSWNNRNPGELAFDVCGRSEGPTIPQTSESGTLITLILQLLILLGPSLCAILWLSECCFDCPRREWRAFETPRHEHRVESILSTQPCPKSPWIRNDCSKGPLLFRPYITTHTYPLPMLWPFLYSMMFSRCSTFSLRFPSSRSRFRPRPPSPCAVI